MPIKTTLLILVIAITCSCVILINDDNSRLYSDSKNIEALNLNDLNKVFDYKTQEEMTFQVVNGNDLKNMVKMNPLTWIFVWGDWCSPCIAKLPKLIEIDKKNPNLKVVLVADGYLTGQQEIILFKAQFNGKPYILDAKTYGTDVKNKVKRLCPDLCPTCTFEPGFPQNYIFKEDGSLVLYQAGGISDSLLVVLGINL